MGKSIVIVESPAKAKTIEKFLGKGFVVEACMGHVRALPRRSGAVDISHDFEPHYEVIPKSVKNLNQIKKLIPGCEKVFLATDLDREGEAIAWHLTQALGLDEQSEKNGLAVKRITFYEVTKPGLDEAMKHPRKISMPLVDAQQARVVLDYLYGFNLSPFLWRKVRSGLSAGRVQSPALRLICERELEIQAFREEEYWSLTAELSSVPTPSPETTFNAQLIEMDGKKLDKLAIKNEEAAKRVVEGLQGVSYRVKDIQKKERKESPPPPFITSTLQQEANTKLRFSAKKTMSVAQKLYEGIEMEGGSEGMITYMRTDSFHLAAMAIDSIRECVEEKFGPEYLNKTVRRFKQKSKTAQEAHEAIRPTDISRTPEMVKPYLSPEQLKLYDLIWRRALASQMAPSVEDRVSVDIRGGDAHVFRAHGMTIKFPGFRKVLFGAREKSADLPEESLPPLSKDQDLTLVSLSPQQHFTKPPPRYTEASLVKTLEEYGIGRPSTYATIISVLQERDYVKLEDRKFVPQEIGMVVHRLLKNHFFQYVDYQFTARIEEELDEVAQGKKGWKPLVRNFWEPFIQLIQVKNSEIRKSDIVNEPTEEVCPQCGKPLINRLGPYGRFLACSGYPNCRLIRSLDGGGGTGSSEEEPTNEVCEKCGRPMAIRKGRYGRFLGCSGYPECKNTKKLSSGSSPVGEPSGETCDKCGESLVVKKGRYGKPFLACPNYPKCTFTKPFKAKVDAS